MKKNHASLVTLGDKLAQSADGIRAFVVVRDGRIVFEYCRHDVRPSDLQQINSVTKSVVGMLVGIALRVGALRDCGRPSAIFCPKHACEASTSVCTASPSSSY